MSRFSLINTLSKLCLSSPPGQGIINRNISTNFFLGFKATPCLMAEPLKKKRKLDPMVIKAREERKKKKIEKQIRRLEKNARQLKPIDECEVPLQLLDEKKSRMRKSAALSFEETERRATLEKKWANYRRIQHLNDLQLLDRLAFSQQQALDELRNESEELYQEAIQIDFRLLPYKSMGPVDTPPLTNYERPDGDYADVSKKW